MFTENFPLVATLSGLVFILAYFTITGFMVRRKPQLLWIPALLLMFVSTCFYWYVYGLTGLMDILPRLTMSIRDAANMFLFNMNSTYARFTDFFYLPAAGGELSAADILVTRQRIIILTSLFLCSIWTTSIMVVHFFARRLTSRMVLTWKVRTRPDMAVSLFLGTDDKSIAVAKSLPKRGTLVFVDFPEQEILANKLSILQLFKNVHSTNRNSTAIKKEIPGALVLKARKPMAHCSAKSFFKDMGLHGLEAWIAHPESTVFLLSDNQEDNMEALRKLGNAPAAIYCHAKREGLALRVETAQDNVHIIDGTYLATKTLKMRRDMYPIRLTDVALTPDGEPAGYVEGAFNALICGFGQAGRGTLAFLYEFGAFAGADKRPSPFHCEVIDRHVDAKSGAFWYRHPAVSRDRVSFRQAEIGGSEFWAYLETAIDKLNFIFVGIGSDDQNLETALDIMDFAFRKRKDKKHFMILVKLTRPSTYRQTIAFYNRNFGGPDSCLKTMGDIQTIWNWNTLSGESYLEKAKEFYAAYNSTTDSVMSWEERNNKIRLKNGSELANKLELARKTEQDFANCFHTEVKAALCPERYWKQLTPVSDYIPLTMEGGRHYVGNDPAEEKVLEYLAIGEHIRWAASLAINGYQFGPVIKEDMRCHKDLTPYELLDEPTKHFDWIVVKTTLEILRNR